jgi:hypothetical protein
VFGALNDGSALNNGNAAISGGAIGGIAVGCCAIALLVILLFVHKRLRSPARAMEGEMTDAPRADGAAEDSTWPWGNTGDSTQIAIEGFSNPVSADRATADGEAGVGHLGEGLGPTWE